jgi:glycerophosphoryl diester phosphodiesterase
MRNPCLVVLLFFPLLSLAQIYMPKFDVEGHRGCRGLRPENSIPAFLLALDSGVTTLEMDVVITKDRQVVVSHEPWMSALICVPESGVAISAKDEKKFNLFKMTYEEVKKWDCGSKSVEAFPEQQKVAVFKPLLSDVIIAVENHIKNKTKYEVDYNIEIKTEPGGDGKFHPHPEEFSDLVYDLLDQYLPMERVIIQSFDFRVLRYWHKKYPKIRLAALVEKKSLDENINELGFYPNIYSPAYKLVNKEVVKYCKNLRMRIIPWTVNDPEDMKSLKAMGVHGFITDYPDRAANLKMTLPLSGKK